MNAIAERWIGDAAANSWTALSSGTRPICGESWKATRPMIISTGRTAPCTAPLKPLPKPIDLDLYRIRRQAQVGGLINEYRLAA
jgi:hypothetical protein